MKKQIKPLTNAQRQKAHRDRLRAGGFKQILLTVHKDVEDRVRRYIKRLNKEYES